MTDASREFISELLRRLHQRLDKSDFSIRELRTDNASMRNQLLAFQGDLNNMLSKMARLEDRLYQVEKRLELRDFQEMGQASYNTGH